MKKIIAIILAAAMIMPTTAFGSTGNSGRGLRGRSSDSAEGESTYAGEEKSADAGEEGTYEEGIDAESIEEAVDNFFSSLEGIIDEWSSAFQDSEDAEYEAEDEESEQREESEEREESEHRGEREESRQYQAYDVIINVVLDDIRDTVDRIIEDFGSVCEELSDIIDEFDAEDEEGFEDSEDAAGAGDVEDEEAVEDTVDEVIEDVDEYLSDWFDDCLTEIEDLIDGAKASYRDFLRLAVPDAGEDDEALEDALEYYNQSIIDGIVEIFRDEILASVLDTAIDSLAGIIEGWDIEDWDIEDWGIDDWEDWSIDDWDIDDWGIGDWDVDDGDIDLWNAWTDYLDWLDEFLNGDWEPFSDETPVFNL